MSQDFLVKNSIVLNMLSNSNIFVFLIKCRITLEDTRQSLFVRYARKYQFRRQKVKDSLRHAKLYASEEIVWFVRFFVR